MKVYYKRVDIWAKWPWNDVIEESYVMYSKSKKKFREFMRTSVQLDMKQRAQEVGKELKVKPSKIELVKT